MNNRPKEVEINEVFMKRVYQIAKEMVDKNLGPSTSVDNSFNNVALVSGKVVIQGRSGHAGGHKVEVEHSIHVEVIVDDGDGIHAHVRSSEEWVKEFWEIYRHLKETAKKRTWTITPSNQLKPFLTPMQEVTGRAK